MASEIPSVTIIATKMASGNVQLVFQSPNGSVRYACVLYAVDVTSINTNVNGGTTGASRTFNYLADKTDTAANPGTAVNPGDYPQGYTTN